MNMMVVACGETAILIDAGVMFPEPELLGVDLVIPDLRLLQQYEIAALVLTHGHEDHIGAVAHVLPYVKGPVYGTAFTLALVGSEARAARPRCGLAARAGEAARSDRRRVFHDRVRARDAQHAGLRGGCDRDAARRRGAHGGFQDRPDPARRRAPGRPPARRSWAQAACWRCSGTARTSSARGSAARRSTSSTAFEEIFTSAAGKIVVAAFASSVYRMQIVVDLAAQFDRQVAFVGRGMQENSEIAQRLGYLRIPAGCRFATARCGTSPPRTSSACAPGRRVSRRRRCRGSRSTITGTCGSSRTTWWCFRRGRFRGTRRRSAA